MGESGKPGIDSRVFGILGTVKRRKSEECRFLPVCFFVEVFVNAERGADKGRGIAPRISGRRDIFLELAANEGRIEGRRKYRQQREQHQEGLRKAAMEAGLTQDKPSLNTSI